MNVLLVDDEKIKRTALRDDLVDAGYDTEVAASAEEGLAFLRRKSFDTVVTDLRMKNMDGVAFLEEIKRHWPKTEVVLVTAYATVDNAVKAMKLGAFDYITKPFESERLFLVLEKVAKIHALATENVSLKAELARVSRHGEIIGCSPALATTLELLDIAIGCDVPVLLWGETGTGKELFATAIQANGLRKDKPFIRVSCAALAPQLMESELFGHERGAFTGATDSKPGRFEMAHKGVLFLDEVDDIPANVQVKLLRVLEGHPFERVGGVVSIETDVRLIAASKVHLKAKVAEGTFRSDLFYRLCVFPIWIPPLRDRREDIPLLLDYFLEKYSTSPTVPTVHEDVMPILWDYHWPGNVREFQNVVRRMILSVGSRSTITRNDIPSDVREVALQAGPELTGPASFRDTIEASERRLLAKALDDVHGNQSRAAANLGMKLSTFRDKLVKYGIHPR